MLILPLRSALSNIAIYFNCLPVRIHIRFLQFYQQISDSSPMLIKTTNNETYTCHLPSSTRKKKLIETADVHLHPDALLAEFFIAYPCIFKVDGYWTYELCHGKHIRQFRAEGSGPKMTRIIKEYYLGRVIHPKKASGNVERKTGDSKLVYFSLQIFA